MGVSEEDEVRFWCTKFGCSRAELEQAVRVVGTGTTAVQAYLARRTPAQ